MAREQFWEVISEWRVDDLLIRHMNEINVIEFLPEFRHHLLHKDGKPRRRKMTSVFDILNIVQ